MFRVRIIEEDFFVMNEEAGEEDFAVIGEGHTVIRGDGQQSEALNSRSNVRARWRACS